MCELAWHIKDKNKWTRGNNEDRILWSRSPLQKALYYITLQGESACNNTMCALAHEWGRVKMETLGLGHETET